MVKKTFRETSTTTPKTYPTKENKELFEAILALKTMDESTKFFRDLLTMAELQEFTNRWQAVKLLIKRKSYLEISQKLKISTATVTRVAFWLKSGLGGYQLIVDRIIQKKESST